MPAMYDLVNGHFFNTHVYTTIGFFHMGFFDFYIEF